MHHFETERFMLVDLKAYKAFLRCPITNENLIWDEDDFVFERSRGTRFPIIDGRPILVDFDRSVLNSDEVIASRGRSQLGRKPTYLGGIQRFLTQPAIKVTDKNIAKIIKSFEEQSVRPRALIIGGGAVGIGIEQLYQDENVDLFSFDIYLSDNVQLVADAHDIPFVDDFFDIVVVQAVLEHVVDPYLVVSEIWRVLKPDGIVYAETPFLQAVHEGPFDFTRFTESGHRYLFRNFDLIASGASGGCADHFLRALDELLTGVFRSRKVGRAAKMMAFWVKYIDLIVPAEYSIDSATGVYFLGRKSANRISERQIIAHYKGAQH